MSKTRVYELAKELGIDNRELIARMEKLGIAVKSHSSSLEDADIERIKSEFELGERSTVIEKRVKRGVIRRRAVRQPTEEGAAEEMEEAVEGAEEILEAAQGAVEKEAVEEEKPAKKEVEAPSKAPPTPVEAEEQMVVELKKEEEKKEESKEVAVEEEKKEVKAEQPAVEKAPEKRPPVPPRGKEKKKPGVVEPVPPKKEEPVEEKGVERPAVQHIKRRPVEVVVDELPTRKKAFAKQRIEKKEKRQVDGRDPDVRRSWKEEKKAVVVQMKRTEITTPKAIKRRIKVNEAIRVGELAKKMGVKASEVIAKLMSSGLMVTINQSIDTETASLIATEFGYQVESVGFDLEEVVQKREGSPENLRSRPPVVTVMGHVDHGKTSLLDAIRETHVIDGESGGITQAIGAYHVALNDRDIVFVDTPGHEAFTAMRARGAQVTDIVVLVVAADDGVMDQTIEAINHARAAGVTIMVAVNKIDKPNADPDRVKQQLSELELMPEQWGGDTIYSEVSAKKREGIEELLELILLQADILELSADPTVPARGVIIESKLDRGRGPVATVIIQEGTLRESDSLVSRSEYCKVRAMLNDKGQRVREAGPSMPVEVIGFSNVPQAGMDFAAVEDERRARSIADYWTRKEREHELSKTTKITLEQLYERIKEGTKEFNVIIKADVQGSVEALSESLLKLSTEDVRLKIIHRSAGTVTETDIMLASASDAIIIGFKVRPDMRVTELAEKEGVEMKLYDVIYDVIADVRAAMEGLLEPLYEEVVHGRAEVRQVFKIPRAGVIAGSYVTDGKITRNSNLRLLRDGVLIHDGKITSLKRFKDDAREVISGFECGIGIENFNDIKESDIIEAYSKEEVQRKLE
ncbi:MAG: translation initiation factor IF-2 [Deltaproteobacteria bacterium]|nr:translation initiation factor IF-2 [Deltaproteobacteria bacterium]